MMRIVHLNTERTWRGGELQTLQLARALSQRGHDNWLACRPDLPLARRVADEGLRMFPLSPLLEFDPLAALRLRGFLRKTRADILQAHTGHAVGLGALACAGTRVKLVATRRVDFPLRKNFLTRWKYDRADAIVCISSRVRAVVLESGVLPEKTALIPSGIDSTGYPSTSDRDRLRRDRGFVPGDLLVVHAAALVPHKDQATLLRAAKRVADVTKARFLILGDGPSRSSLETRARDLGLGERVSFLGFRPDVLEWIALSDLFVFSSREEGLGTALLDAMAIGVPSAATSAGGTPDIYGGASASELSPPGDSEALARNMLSVLNDPGEARQRVERGRQLVKNFTADAMVDSYEKLYKKLMENIV